MKTEGLETSDPPTARELSLVARHGSGDLVRSLAIVQLARRRDRTDDLLDLLDEPEAALNE